MGNALDKYLIRAYHSTLLRHYYWYTVDPTTPFNDYPVTYPPIVPVNPYIDVVLYDLPSGGGGGTGDGVDLNIPFFAVGNPAAGDVVYFTSGGVVLPAIADYSGGLEDCVAIGVATSTPNYVRKVGKINTKCLGVIAVGDGLYLSTVTSGAVSTIIPFAAPNAIVYIGQAESVNVGGFCDVILDIQRPIYL